MCGLAGFLHLGGFDAEAASAIAMRMAGALKHRGPDDFGAWLDADAGIAMAHRRLAIIDLTAAGHQPMESECGRFVLAFNGEIYNHLELRRKLGCRTWRGHCDTETLLVGIQQWGLVRALQESVGMFAVALWDRETRTLSLARDRMGEKPLYYGWQGKSFLFGSEIKALSTHPDFVGNIDRLALGMYVRQGYVPAPFSIFAGISKLVPGSILDVSSVGPGEVMQPRPYWSLKQVVNTMADRRFNGRPDEAVEELEALLTDAVKQQQISDVPLGAFLSGGTDSSAVVAVMQSICSMPVKTFTIGFEEQGYNEAPYARAVAGHLGTEHTEMYVTAKDAMAVIPDLPAVYDEPFSDLSQIPTMLLCRLASQYVTVALSGDGGDELFCGYGRYPRTARYWSQLSIMPLRLRRALSNVLPNRVLAKGLRSADIDSFYEFMLDPWRGYRNIVNGQEGTPRGEALPEALREPKERMMYKDALAYLPDDILVKVDRAAMSVSLETRIPLLDHRVVELAWRLPMEMKFRNGFAKWPLKEILYKYLPKHLVDRPKAGFDVPMQHWLRGPLRGWAEELLAKDRLKGDGFFDPEPIRAEWDLHLSGGRDRHFGLWTILMFQEWYKHIGTLAADSPDWHCERRQNYWSGQQRKQGLSLRRG